MNAAVLALVAVNAIAGALVATVLRTARAHHWWAPITTRHAAAKPVVAQPIEDRLMTNRPAAVVAVIALVVLAVVVLGGCNRPADRTPATPVTATAEVPQPVNTSAASLSVQPAVPVEALR